MKTERNHLGAVLTRLMKECDLDDAEVSRATGLSRSTITRLRIYQGNPTVSNLKPLADLFDITIDQLLGFSPINSKGRLPGQHKSITQTAKKIPLIDLKNVSVWATKKTLKNDSIKITWIDSCRNVGEDVFAININSSVTNYSYKDNSIAIIDPKTAPQHDDIVLVSKKDSGAYLKKVFIEGDSLYLTSINPAIMKIEEINSEEKICGTVIETLFHYEENDDYSCSEDSDSILSKIKAFFMTKPTLAKELAK